MIGPTGFRRGHEIAQEREGHTMKLDIEALAREAGISILWGTDDNCNAKQYYEGWPEQIEAFSRLIVERCAVECDNKAVDDMTGYGIADDCAAAIRQLLEDK